MTWAVKISPAARAGCTRYVTPQPAVNAAAIEIVAAMRFMVSFPSQSFIKQHLCRKMAFDQRLPNRPEGGVAFAPKRPDTSAKGQEPTSWDGCRMSALPSIADGQKLWDGLCPM